MEFLHPAMWHVALESWQWIHQVAALWNVIRGSGMTCHWIHPNVRHIGILHMVSISTHHRSRHVILYQIRAPSAKKSRHVDFQDGVSQPSYAYITSYRSSIDIVALLLSFWENRVICILATDRQTDIQMDIIDSWSRSLVIASCALISINA